MLRAKCDAPFGTFGDTLASACAIGAARRVGARRRVRARKEVRLVRVFDCMVVGRGRFCRWKGSNCGCEDFGWAMRC